MTRQKKCTEQDIIKMLAKAVDKAGGVRPFCRENPFTPQFISKVINGKEPVTTRLAEHFGFVRTVKVEFLTSS